MDKATELLYCGDLKTGKGSFISYPENVSCDQMDYVRNQFAGFVDSSSLPLAADLINIDGVLKGIPVTYELHPDGADFVFWLVNFVDKDQQSAAIRLLRKERDIHRVEARRVDLVFGWNPPSPFENIVPDWLNSPDVSILDGERL
jgi:hypothetical protein